MNHGPKIAMLQGELRTLVRQYMKEADGKRHAGRMAQLERQIANIKETLRRYRHEMQLQEEKTG